MIDSQVLDKSVTKNDGGPVVFQFVTRSAPCRDILPDLPAEWSPSRDFTLRSTLRYDGFWASAVRRAVSQAASRMWEIRGEEASKVRAAQELFLAANTVGYTRDKVPWGHGWGHFLDQHLRAYVLTNNGAFTEVVYNGSKVVGFVHLDPYRCERTGEEDVPVIYTDRNGWQHELRQHECFMLADFVSESHFENGIGMCAAERVYDEIRIHSVVQKKYWERVAGRTADRVHFISGIKQSQLNDIMSDAEDDADNQGYAHYMGNILSAVPGETDMSSISIDLSGVDTDYDRKRDYEIARNRYALALDMDPQDLSPLSGASDGVGAQSRTLDRKNRRTTLFGWDSAFMDVASRFILDSTTKFVFSESQDGTDERQKAETLGRVGEGVKQLVESMVLTPDQGVQLGVEYEVFPDEFLIREGTRGPLVLSRSDRSTLLEEQNNRAPLPVNAATSEELGRDGIDYTADEGSAAAGEGGTVLGRLRKFVGGKNGR